VEKMSEENEFLTQLKSKNMRKEVNKEIIKKVIKEKYGYELPLTDSRTTKYGYDKVIEIVNILFNALVEAYEEA
jgi:ethanolamine utilization protein EutQ (cupin superfamily)